MKLEYYHKLVQPSLKAVTIIMATETQKSEMFTEGVLSMDLAKV